MELSAPGEFWYKAILQSVTQTGDGKIIGSFKILDSQNSQHNGFAVDGVTVQELHEIEIDPTNVAAVKAAVQLSLQNLALAEYSGDIGAVIQACIYQGTAWQ